jgi:hypothetical protein
MKRPIGVVVLALACLVISGLLFLACFAAALSGENPWGTHSQGVAAMLFLLASLHAMLGAGLLRLNYWARQVTLLFAVVNLLLFVAAPLIQSTDPLFPALLKRKVSMPTVLMLALLIWIQWYLRRPQVKSAFGVKTI